MKTAKYIIFPSIYTAILIGGQFVFSGVSGIELVTVLLLAYCYKYGVKQGLLVANAFSLLRCFVFGFFPSVILLYLIYYNIFAIVFGLFGNVCKNVYGKKKHIVTVLIALAMTALFTLTDNLLTPLLYGFTKSATRAYFITSLYTLVPQLLCTLVTVAWLFPIILKILPRLKTHTAQAE